MYLKAEAWDRIKELTSKESLAMLGVFATVWVGSQFTPVGWAADALVLVMTIGGCILLGPHLLEVGSLLESFYKKATNAGHNEAQYRSAGEDFARVVTLLGVDVLMVLVFHVAKAPVHRLVVRVKQGGVGKLPGAKPAEVPVEEPLAPGKGKGKGEPRSNESSDGGVMGRRAEGKGFEGIETTKNGGLTFKNSPCHYEEPGVKSVVKIKMQGRRSADFREANRAAGLPGSKPPKGYTWHHIDDFNSVTGESTMELVKTEVHVATFPHKGSVYQYEKHTGNIYK